MSAKLPVLILTKDPLVAYVGSLLHNAGIPVETAETVADARKMMSFAQEFVAIVDNDLPNVELAQAKELISQDKNALPLVIVASTDLGPFGSVPELTPRDEYILRPFQPRELELRVKAAMVRAGHKVTDNQGAWLSSPTHARDRRDNAGSVISIVSAKGGVGKTTVSVNLAVGLARFHQKKVLLVDADLSFGGTGVLMNVYSKKSVLDVSRNEFMPFDRLQDALTLHNSGVAVLMRPHDVTTTEHVNSQSLIDAITQYRLLFDFIIVDTPSSLDELNLQLMNISKQVLVICTPETSAVHNTSRYLDILQALGNMHKVSLVLNRAHSGISIDALESTLGMASSALITSDGEFVVAATNEGLPIFDKDPQLTKQVSRDLEHLTSVVVRGMGPLRTADSESESNEGLISTRMGA